MTRYLLAAATLAGALSLATPAAACDLEHCPVTRHLCDVIDCSDPVPVHQCIYTTDFVICI